MLLLSLATAAAVTCKFFVQLSFSPFINARFTVVAAGSCVRQYTVQQGDTCDKISAAQNVST